MAVTTTSHDNDRLNDDKTVISDKDILDFYEPPKLKEDYEEKDLWHNPFYVFGWCLLIFGITLFLATALI